MALTAEGSKFYFSPTFGAAKNITAATNASPAVATSVAHGFVDGDELLYVGGWEDASKGIYRADQLSADTVALTGLNATNTNFYAPGAGVGTLKKVSGWIEIPEVITIGADGNQQEFIDLRLVSSRYAQKIPTGFTPGTVNMTMVFDAGSAAYQAMLDATMSRTLVAFKMVLSDSAAVYAYGYISASKAPSIQSGQVIQVPVTFAIQGQYTTYA